MRSGPTPQPAKTASHPCAPHRRTSHSSKPPVAGLMNDHACPDAGREIAEVRRSKGPAATTIHALLLDYSRRGSRTTSPKSPVQTMNRNPGARFPRDTGKRIAAFLIYGAGIRNPAKCLIIKEKTFPNLR